MIYFICVYLASFIAYFVLKMLNTHYSFRQFEREEGLLTHKVKNGTATMGGTVFVLIPSIFLLSKNFTIKNLLLVCVFISFSFIGFIDDYKVIKNKNNEGLSPKKRLIFEYAISFIAIIILLILGCKKSINIFGYACDLGFFFIPVISTFLVGSANSYNLTDGVDSLLASLSVIISFGLLIISFDKKEYDISFFLMCLIISLCAFYFLNYNKAALFMGDTGSLAIGGVLSFIALMLDSIFVFAIMSMPLYFETFSDIIQVFYYKKTKGKRLFLMAPFHHHLELLGYSEKMICALFSLVEIVLVLFCLYLLNIFN